MYDFKEGDVVKCRVYDYASYNYGDFAVIIKVNENTLTIRNDASPYGTSDYVKNNWIFVRRPQKKDNQMAYEKTKYFGIKMTSIGKTEMYDHQSEVRTTIKERLQEGEQWIIVQTLCMIEYAEPKPPIKVTEYR